MHAIENNVSVQDVDYAVLRKRLLSDGQVLDIPKGSGVKRLLAIGKLDGIVVDDSDAEYKGTWTNSGSIGPYVERGYHHDGNSEKGQKLAVFMAKVKTGRYDVRLGYVAHSNRATNVPVRIVSSSGTQLKRVNPKNEAGIQRRIPQFGHV